MILSLTPRGTISLTGALGGDRNAALRAAIDLGLGDGLAFGEQHAGVEILEAIVQQLLGVVGAVLGILQSGDHDDQPHAVLHRGADQIVAGLVGEAGLHAVGAIDGAEQRIAVLLADLVPGEFALAEPFVVVGIVQDDVARHHAPVRAA